MLKEWAESVKGTNTQLWAQINHPGRQAMEPINRNASWVPGDSLNLGIGQGFLSATPTQIASMTMVLANKGQWHQVRMIKAINGQAVTKVSDIGRNDPKQPIDIKLKRNSDWDGVHNAMIDVMHGAKGTGRRSGANSSYKMAGKTGTAQVLGIKQDSTYDADKIAERFRDHGLYIGWAPVNNPKIAQNHHPWGSNAPTLVRF